MAAKRPTKFNPKTFLGKVGTGKTNLTLEKHHTIFSQGDEADAVFFIKAGKVKLSIVSQQGKEAVLALLEPGAFFGESCLAGQIVRMATAVAEEASVLVRIEKKGERIPRLATADFKRSSVAGSRVFWPQLARIVPCDPLTPRPDRAICM